MAAMEKNNKNLNVPNLRFPEFSGEWKKYLLKSITNIYDGTHQTPKYTKSGVPFMSVEDVTQKSSKEQKYISEQDFQNDFRNPPQKGDILMTRIGNIGTPCIVPTNEALGYYVSLALIRPLEKLQSCFLNYAIQSNSFKRELYKRTIHVAFPQKINKEDIGKCKLDVPSIEEQSRIGDLLSLIDERITTQKKIIEDLKKLKDAISFILFTSETCDKWELSNLATIVMGQSPSSQCYNTDNDGLPLIQGNLDITKGKLTPRLYSSEMTKKCHTGDVILTVRAPVGEVAIADFDACIGRGVCAIRPFNNNYSVLIYQFLQHYKPKWISLEQGSTFTSVSRNDIMSIKIGVPSIQAIEILNILDDKISIEDVILNNLNSQKNYLLAQMFI